MSDAIKSFSFEILLRNFFSGVFFLAAFYRATGFSSSEVKQVVAALPLLIPLSLALGIATYALHRSLLNPFYDLLHCRPFVIGLRDKCAFMNRDAARHMVNRWLVLGPVGSEQAKIQFELKKWSDYIHFQYGSFLSITLGAASGWYFNDKVVFDLGVAVIAAVFFLAASLSDWRRHFIEDNYLDDHWP